MNYAIIIPFTILISAFLLRLPIAVGMISASTIYFVIKGMDIGLVAQAIMSNLNSNYILIAVPLFIFSALVMNTGLVTERIFNFANLMVGRFKGGLGHVNILASLIFSGMTGSAVADASGLGIMEIESMRKAGYDDSFSCAVTACSAVIGPIFPPSIPMLIYSMLSGASIGALFLAGVVPGILLAFALMSYNVYISGKRNYPRGTKYPLKECLLYTIKALPALFTPVLLLICIYTGITTATEAAAIAALYALVISIFVYRSMGFGQLKSILVETILKTGSIGFMIGSVFAFSFIITNERISDNIAGFIINIDASKYLFLFIINIFFLILGMFLDVNTMQFIFLPIVIPTIQALGIDLVHFGVVIVLNMMIGLTTPPFGMLLFIVSSFSTGSMKSLIKELLPMIGVMIIVLFLITYIPEITLFLPNSIME